MYFHTFYEDVLGSIRTFYEDVLKYRSIGINLQSRFIRQHIQSTLIES
jgi:hypothetical protein